MVVIERLNPLIRSRKIQYICFARMCNLAGRLRNWTPSCTTGRPDVLPESLPILLLNRATIYVRHIASCATNGILVAIAINNYREYS